MRTDFLAKNLKIQMPITLLRIFLSKDTSDQIRKSGSAVLRRSRLVRRRVVGADQCRVQELGQVCKGFGDYGVAGLVDVAELDGYGGIRDVVRQ